MVRLGPACGVRCRDLSGRCLAQPLASTLQWPLLKHLMAMRCFTDLPGTSAPAPDSQTARLLILHMPTCHHVRVLTNWAVHRSASSGLVAASKPVKAVLAREIVHHLLEQRLDGSAIQRREHIQLSFGLGRQIPAKLDFASSRGWFDRSVGWRRVRLDRRCWFCFDVLRNGSHGQARSACHGVSFSPWQHVKMLTLQHVSVPIRQHIGR